MMVSETSANAFRIRSAVGWSVLLCLFSGGLDHGAGHSLLLLCDAKTPRDKKSKEFKGLGHYLCNLSIGLL